MIFDFFLLGWPPWPCLLSGTTGIFGKAMDNCPLQSGASRGNSVGWRRGGVGGGPYLFSFIFFLLVSLCLSFLSFFLSPLLNGRSPWKHVRAGGARHTDGVSAPPLLGVSGLSLVWNWTWARRVGIRRHAVGRAARPGAVRGRQAPRRTLFGDRGEKNGEINGKMQERRT